MAIQEPWVSLPLYKMLHVATWPENPEEAGLWWERKGEADVQRVAEMRGRVCSWVADKLPKPQFLRLGYIPALGLHETPLILKPSSLHFAAASPNWFLLLSSKSVLTNTRKFLFHDLTAHIVLQQFMAETNSLSEPYLQVQILICSISNWSSTLKENTKQNKTNNGNMVLILWSYMGSTWT